MAVIGAAMKVARQPETGRHYPSDRCPVASDGREQGKEEGKRGASLALGVRCNSQELVRHFWRELPVKLIHSRSIRVVCLQSSLALDQRRRLESG